MELNCPFEVPFRSVLDLKPDVTCLDPPTMAGLGSVSEETGVVTYFPSLCGTHRRNKKMDLNSETENSHKSFMF